MSIKELSFDDLIPSSTQRAPISALSFDDLIPKQRDATLYDRAQAAASGFNSGVLTGLAGLPVDTVLNVADLAKAGYGMVKSALGSTDLPELADRKRVAGSSEWIANQIRNAGAGAAIDPNLPRDDVSRYLHAAGSAVGNSVLGARVPQGYNASAAATAAPNLIAQGAKDAGMAAASGMSSLAAMDATGNPVMAALAGFAPQATTYGMAAGTRGAARGGEASRQEMADRLQTLQSAGVESPSVGLASGGRKAQALESMLSRVPGAAGVMARNAEDVANQLGNRATGLADKASTVRGPETAGQTVRSAIGDPETGYRARQQAIENRMIGRLENVIPPDVLFPATGLMGAGAAATAPIVGASAITGVRDSQRAFVNRMTSAVERDAGPTQPQQVPSPIIGPEGQPLTSTDPGRPGGLPFDALRQTKTLIGENAYPAANQLVIDQSTGAAKLLYGGAKDDIRNAAAITDRQRVAQGQEPKAVALMERADRFYAATQRILEDVLQPIYKGSEGAPERAYYAIERGANNAGSLTRQTMLSLPAEARAQVGATVVDRLGRASPGQQNDVGSTFSPQTFLSNWNKITPEAKASLFTGYKNAGLIRSGLDNIAASVTMIREKAKVFPNASNTASASAQLGMAGGIGGALASGDATLIAAAFGAPAMAYTGAKLMTNPIFATWLSKATTIPESRIVQHLNRLAINSTAVKDPEERLAIQSFVQQLREQLD